MSTSHTPGPWDMAGPVGRATWIQTDAHPNIAAVHGACTTEGDANARLIAAAPDLLAALQLVCDTYGFDPSIDSAIWQTAFAALVKAGGK